MRVCPPPLRRQGAGVLGATLACGWGDGGANSDDWIESLVPTDALWFGYIARPSQWGGGGYFTRFKWFLPAIAALRWRGGGVSIPWFPPPYLGLQDILCRQPHVPANSKNVDIKYRDSHTGWLTGEHVCFQFKLSFSPLSYFILIIATNAKKHSQRTGPLMNEHYYLVTASSASGWV